MDNVGHISTNIIGVLEGEERKGGKKKLFDEIMAENFPNLGKETHPGTGRTDSHKKDESKEIHTKICYN